nr:glycosyltransferase 61 family protein [Gluconacetobacter tumulisoli]
MIHDHFVGNNYCHWVLDWLPRLHLLEQTGANLRDHTFVFPRALAPFQRQSLDALGIGPGQIIEIPKDPDQTHRPIVAFRHFVATSTIRSSYAHALHGGARWAADFLQTRLARRIRPAGIRNIIIERRRTRRLILSRADQRRLSRNGFVSIDPETLTLAEQIALFRGARRIIAAHGAGLANLVFCRPGARVLEIFPPDYSTPAYWLTAVAAGMKYSCAVGTRVLRPDVRHIRDHDILLSHDVLSKWMIS